ncbi:MAG: hypothetical protein ACTHWZ_09005 [Peptoniphilaceae bacterium]
MIREKQKNEAIKRMKTLELYENVIKEFQEENKLNLSESIGVLYWLKEEEKELVKEFENENGGLVYHLIRSLTDFGELYSIFYVSKYEEEWDMDLEDLKDNIAFVYVKNINDELSSEFGSIGFKKSIGGLVRTA